MDYLGSDCFSECPNLKKVELSSCVHKYGDTSRVEYTEFSECTNISEIVCKTATPPAVKFDPFPNVNKSNVTLYVPDFAVPIYKLDSYWNKFGNIQSFDITLDYWRIAGDLVLSNNRRMGGKPDVDIFYGGKLTVSGNDAMPVKNLDLYVSEGNAGQLLNNCGQFTADSITTRFSVGRNNWYFITPMHDVKLSEVKHTAGADFIFRYYNSENRAQNGTTGNASWQDVNEDILHAGQGYIYQCNADGELIMPAVKETQANIFTMAEITRELKTYEAENPANENWNFVGNPYPCNYDIYYMDFTAPITVRNGSNYAAYAITDDELVLRPMQAVFVQKPNDVDKIVFRHEGRQLSSTVNRVADAPARAKAQKGRFLFNLEITDGERTDRTRVVFNQKASLGYEMERDAAKFMSDDPLMPQIYSIDQEQNRLAINERPEKDGLVSLGVHIGCAGYYTIKATRADAEVKLFDAETGLTINLSEEDYTFYSDKADYAARFLLNANGATGIADTAADAPALSPAFNLAGQKVGSDYKGITIKNGKKVVRK